MLTAATSFESEKDVAFSDAERSLWDRARHWLDIRSNDVHTLISYRFARSLLRWHPNARRHVVCPAILLHDVGWSCYDEEKIIYAVGPHARYPEYQRLHEIEGAKLAWSALEAEGVPDADLESIVAIIDGHDTRAEAISLDDAIVKDSDKLWRLTDHGVRTISEWWTQGDAEAVLPMICEATLPKLLTDQGRQVAQALLTERQADIFWRSTMSLVGRSHEDA